MIHTERPQKNHDFDDMSDPCIQPCLQFTCRTKTTYFHTEWHENKSTRQICRQHERSTRVIVFLPGGTVRT